jgi:hypothetical protein
MALWNSGIMAVGRLTAKIFIDDICGKSYAFVALFHTVKINV